MLYQTSVLIYFSDFRFEKRENSNSKNQKNRKKELRQIDTLNESLVSGGEVPRISLISSGSFLKNFDMEDEDAE